MTRSLPTLDEARRTITASVAALPAEPVALEDALGRLTAVPTLAAEPLPGFDNSAMDGYAVRAADTAGAPLTLRVSGESRAGRPCPTGLAAGEAIRVSTGAQLPAGADAVVREELAGSQGDGAVRVHERVEPGRDVRRRGEEVGAGDALIGAAVRLRPADLGALAAAGVLEVSCVRRPRVAVVVTGDELTPRDGPLPPGGVRDSNRAMLAALARERGAEVVFSQMARDDEAAIAATLAGAFAAAPDLVVSCAGMSVGPHDHVRGALGAAGVELAFAGVALTPGRPAAFGTGPGGAAFLGLPGNPFSALVAFRLLAEPALGIAPRAVVLAAARPLARRRTSTHAVPVRVAPDAAVPTGASGHGPTAALGADGLALVGPGEGELSAGTPVEVALL